MKAGGDQTVSSGGTAHGTVLSGGAEYVRGTASGTIVSSGGTENVHGVANGGRVVDSGGTERVFGRASGGTVSSGGRQIVSAGGVASGVTVKAGGSQIVFSGGRTVGAVLSGGTEYVSSGGAASGTIVGSGGKEIVYAGGTTNATRITGGLVEVMSGAHVGGSLFKFAGGGTLQLDHSVYFKGRVAGFAVPDRLDLRDIAFVAGITTVSFTEAAGSTSGTLSVTNGARTAKLTLLGSYVTSQFHLAGDGHGGTLVTDPPVAGGGASQTTFADIAPAPLLSGSSDPGNPANHLPGGASATNDPAYGAGGQTVLPTGPPGGSLLPSEGSANRYTLLPAPR